MTREFKSIAVLGDSPIKQSGTLEERQIRYLSLCPQEELNASP